MEKEAEAFYKKSFVEHYGKADRTKVLQDAAELAWMCEQQRAVIATLLKQRNLFAGGCEAAYEVLTAHGLEIDPKLAEAFALAIDESQAGMVDADKRARKQAQAVAVSESIRQAAVNAVSNSPQVKAAEANKKALCDIWAEGNFSSRDKCALEECAALGVEFKAARAYLTNTPDPDPWPAKSRK